VGQAAKDLRKRWRERYTRFLDMVFDAAASEKTVIRPDEAMDCLEKFLAWDCERRHCKSGKDTSDDPPVMVRFNLSAFLRDAHHYAVDRFYKTYFPRKRGGEPLSTSYLDSILRLRFKGLNYVAIAGKLGVPRDRMRKQVGIAEKRWGEAVERIEQLKQRFPHLVATNPATGGSESQTCKQQSKSRKAKPRAGK